MKQCCTIWTLLWIFGFFLTLRAVWVYVFNFKEQSISVPQMIEPFKMNWNQYTQFLAVITSKSYDFHSSKVSYSVLVNFFMSRSFKNFQLGEKYRYKISKLHSLCKLNAFENESPEVLRRVF